MSLSRVLLALAVSLTVVVGSAQAAPNVTLGATNTSSHLSISASGNPLHGGGTFKYGKANYNITITNGYSSPDGTAAHLTGYVVVNGARVPCSVVCNKTSGYVEIQFGTVHFWAKGTVSITK